MAAFGRALLRLERLAAQSEPFAGTCAYSRKGRHPGTTGKSVPRGRSRQSLWRSQPEAEQSPGESQALPPLVVTLSSSSVTLNSSG